MSTENQLLPATEGVRLFPDGRMTVEAAAAYTGLKPKTLAAMRTNGTGPEFIRVGGKRVFYKKEALDRYIEAGRAITTKQRKGSAHGQ